MTQVHKQAVPAAGEHKAWLELVADLLHESPPDQSSAHPDVERVSGRELHDAVGVLRLNKPAPSGRFVQDDPPTVAR